MIQVTNRFRENIYAQTRKTTAKVTFEILDVEAYKDNSITLPAESIISRGNQLTNKVRIMSRKYATFELDYFRLDGSFHIPPKSNEGDSELGYWGEDLSDGSGYFIPEQVIEVNFTKPHNSIGLTIAFDILTNEYAEDFDIEVHGDELYTQEVRGNDQPLYVLEKTFDNYTKILIRIKKWCKPYRRARVVEIDFGLIKEYKDNKLIKLNILEEMNIIGDTIPSNELVFTVENTDRAFNILNPEGYYKYLQEYQEVTTEIGLNIDGDIEFIPMGKYYLTEWRSDEGTLTTTFTARDIFEILDNIDYVGQKSNLYDLAVDVFEKAGIEEYKIDTRLKNIPTNGFNEPVTSRQALQCIGIAGQCMIYQDRFGVPTIRHFDTLSESTGYITFAGMDAYAGVTIPEVDENFDFKYISFDNVYKEPQIKLDTLVKSVTVIVHDGTEEGQKVTIYNAGVSKGSALELDNPLINTIDHAKDVAEWIIRESNLRAIYDIDWRQNPAFECGDVVLVEDSFGAMKRSKIIKQEFNFDGALSGKTETKGGV